MADYTRLAALINSHPELNIVRQFGELRAKNLLYLQAELVHLEAELADIEKENKFSGDSEGVAFQTSLFDLRESSATKKGLQWRKSLEVRNKLKEYNDALLQYSQIQALRKPEAQNIKTLRGWLDRPEGGDFFLRGREAEIWDGEADLISLDTQTVENDNLTRLIKDRLIPWYHYRWGHRLKKPGLKTKWNGLWHYEDAKLIAVANIISTVLSSLLPTSSILALYFVQRPLARLAFTMLFTSAFSFTLAVVTRARRVDIFAATTAFAAVQVVFLGTGFGSA